MTADEKGKQGHIRDVFERKFMTRKSLNIVAATISVAGIWIAVCAAHAADISVIATQAVKSVYLDLAPEFERATQHRLSTAWVGTSIIVQRIREGEVVDVVFLPRGSLDQLIKLGRLAPGSRVDIATSGVGVAVRAGAPTPDIGSGDALKRALLAARSIAYSSGSSGNYIAGLFMRMKIGDEVKPKARQLAPGMAVGEVVARGEAELGFQQISELLPIPGITFVGPLPPEMQIKTLYSGAVHVAAKAPEAAMELLRFLKTPAALPAIRKAGMEPVDTP